MLSVQLQCHKRSDWIERESSFVNARDIAVYIFARSQVVHADSRSDESMAIIRWSLPHLVSTTTHYSVLNNKTVIHATNSYRWAIIAQLELGLTSIAVRFHEAWRSQVSPRRLCRRRVILTAQMPNPCQPKAFVTLNHIIILSFDIIVLISHCH